MAQEVKCLVVYAKKNENLITYTVNIFQIIA